MKLPRHVFIPYFHSSLELKCDFIFQTIRQLLQREFIVHLILCQHQHWYPALLMNHSRYIEIKNKIRKNLPMATAKNFHVITTVYLYPKWFSIFLQRFNQYNEVFSTHHIQSYISQFKSGIVWNFDPQNNRLISSIHNKRFIKLYDCVDYYSSLDPDIRRKIKVQEKEVLNNTDIVFANSHTLVTHCKKYNSHVFFVPQGFDLDSMSEKINLENEPDRDIYFQTEAISKQKIGFIGNLTFRIDFSLVSSLIKAFPQYHFLLSDTYLSWDSEDRICETRKHIAQLKSLPNITWIPPMPRRSIKKWIGLCSVCIIPYDARYELNTYSYPMKLFEYFYMGKPVVSTPIDELERFPKYVRIGKTATEWEKHITSLLLHTWPKNYHLGQRKLAMENSWEKKIDSIYKYINVLDL